MWTLGYIIKHLYSVLHKTFNARMGYIAYKKEMENDTVLSALDHKEKGAI